MPTDMESWTPWLVAGAITIGIISSIAEFFWKRCGACGRFNALIPSDKKRFPDGSEYVRYYCRFCNARPWQEQTPERHSNLDDTY
jgi:hypothetical protein